MPASLFSQPPDPSSNEQFPRLFAVPTESEQDQPIAPPTFTLLAPLVSEIFPSTLPDQDSSVAGPPADQIATVTLDEILGQAARNTGFHVQAGKGAGKSRLQGRAIAWHDHQAQIPTVCLDPIGSTIDNLLDVIRRLPEHKRRQFLERVLYVDMAGAFGRVTPSPLYYRYRSDSLHTAAQRLLETFKKLEPALANATVMGWPALHRVGTSVGMILAALNWQITEAESLLANPSAYLPLLTELAAQNAEVAPAVRFIQRLASMTATEQARMTDAFSTRIAQFTLDPVAKAMYGLSSGIDWSQVEEQQLTVLVDFRKWRSLEELRFKMLWFVTGFLEYLNYRGMNRDRPISLIIDEMVFLQSLNSLQYDLLAADLDKLVNITARNYNLWLTLSHQELFQLDEKSQDNVLGMGTQILGVTTDLKAAIKLARRFFPYTPHWVKKRIPIWTGGSVPQVVDFHTEEYSAQEQELIQAKRFMQLQKFEFLVALPNAEGSPSTTLRRLSTADLDRDQYIDPEAIQEMRQELAERSGIAIEEAIAEIDRRQVAKPNEGSEPSSGGFVPPPRRSKRTS